MAAIPSDYDSNPSRWRSWESPEDVHAIVAAELCGPVLDVGCGEGRLASLLEAEVQWTGLDNSPAQLAGNPYRPVVLGDMRKLPFADATFAEVTHLWCLYHLEDPAVAIREAARVLVPGGRYFACTAARTNDPELMPEGYAPTSFDAEEAEIIVSEVFDDIAAQWWDQPVFALATREELRAYCRHALIPLERAENASLPLWPTKRGVLIRATKGPSRRSP